MTPRFPVAYTRLAAVDQGQGAGGEHGPGQRWVEQTTSHELFLPRVAIFVLAVSAVLGRAAAQAASGLDDARGKSANARKGSG